ncbi:MAG TPA: LysR family transcriptional regulator [Xanthobacteraceae bacterium]|nr:LysR family transcriptional regulator [Xanthobacteraceae bacterium]
MDRIEDIEVFAEVAGQGSFTAAARRLNRSPAAVTRAVADLEARLGVRLLNRTTRAVSLTDAGERFLGGARRVLADLTEIEQAAAGQGSAPRGELAVTAPILFGRLHVLPVVNAFLRQFPDVSVRLMLLDRPVDLTEERLDAAIRIGPLADSSAIVATLGSLRRVVVAAPSYLQQRGAPQHPAEIAGYDVVVFGGLGAGQWDFGADGAVRLSPRPTVTTAEAAIDAVSEGMGITRVLGYQAADALARGAVTQLLAAFGREATPVSLLYPGGAHPPPKLRAFIDFAVPKLRARLAEIEQALA